MPKPIPHESEILDLAASNKKVLAANKALDRVDSCNQKQVDSAVGVLEAATHDAVLAAAKKLGSHLSTRQIATVESHLMDLQLEDRFAPTCKVSKQHGR